MTKRTLIGFILILAVLAALLAWAALQPPAARPNVTVAFVGYTNDATGARLATFTVRNGSPSAVRRLSHYRVQVPMAARWTNLAVSWFSGGGSVLRAGSSETIKVPAATNQLWRVSISVSPEVGFVREVMGSLAESVHAAGLRTRYRKMSYGVQCDWIGE